MAGPVSGAVERVGSRWIFGRTTSIAPLRGFNSVRKGFWDTLFEVYVTSDSPVAVTLTRPALRSRVLVGALALFVVAVAAATVLLVAN